MIGKITLLLLMTISLSLQGQSDKDTLPTYFPSILELTHPELINQLNVQALSHPQTYQPLKVFSPSLKHTAFFCKIEDKLGKKAKIPVKMRLGDVEYVDRIEGKGIQTHIPK